jgi:general secretion pathway protein D
MPQGVLLPDLPASDRKAVPRSAGHGAEGQSSANAFIWSAASGRDRASARDAMPERQERRTVAEAGREGVTLNLLDAPIADAAKAVLGDLLNVNYVVDGRVKGTVTVQTTRPVRRDAIVDVLDTALSGQGARIVVDGDLYRIVPAAEAAVSGARVRIAGEGRTGPGVSVHVVPLRYVAASDMEQVLKSVAPQNAILRVDTARNVLMLLGTQAEIVGLLEVIDLFDVDSLRGMSFALLPVDSADPTAVAQELDTLFGNDTANPSRGIVRFVPNRRLRAVLAISSRPDDLRRAADTFNRLQNVARAGERQLFSYKVRNRPAGELAQLLLRVYGAAPAVGRPGAAGGLESTTVTTVDTRSGPGEMRPFAERFGAAAASAPGLSARSATTAVTVAVPGAPADAATPAAATLPAAGEERAASAGGIGVVPDEPNRMLLITATRAEYKRILSILDRIDTMPDQVLIEATIAEVALNDQLRLGLRWFFDKSQNQFTFSDALNGAIAPTFPGFSYFFNSVNVQVVLNALSAVTDVNVVSSPTLTVLDGKRALLQVGDEVPIVTQQAVSTITAGAPVVNSVQYRNTGVILGIVPRINERGRVVLEIEQEVSEVGATTTSRIDSPTIQQRRLRTTVVVKDGESLALGGLMQDRSSLARDQTPLVGELPVLGNLFKSKNDVIRRTELLIIMTPRVVRDVHQVRAVTDEFRDRMNFSLRPQRQGPPRPAEKLERVLR